MTSKIRESFQDGYLLVTANLKNNEMKKNTLEVVKGLRGLVDYLPAPYYDRMTAIALNCGLYFRPSKRLAVISGAGIAGLAASFELRARGFNVVIIDKRVEFSRFNIINLNVETQFFLKKFNLLEEFEALAARIDEHREALIQKNGNVFFKESKAVKCSSPQLNESASFKPENFNKLFRQEGIYSVSIGGLQTFLAEHALRAGVSIFGNVRVRLFRQEGICSVSNGGLQTFLAEHALRADVNMCGNERVRILSRTEAKGVSKIKITADRFLRPDLFFIAEGTRSTTALQLGMGTSEVINACTDENWIFGNMAYFGKKTFVVSLIDASNTTLRIANLIFNAKSQVINVAVTLNKKVNGDSIQKQILQIADQVLFPMGMPSILLNTVSKPVQVINQISSPFSMGNVFCIGDSAGSSSPLAGLGGTLGLTLVPLTVRQLLDDYERQSTDINENFHRFSEAYTSRWIEKSQYVKDFCLKTFDNERNPVKKSKIRKAR